MSSTTVHPSTGMNPSSPHHRPRPIRRGVLLTLLAVAVVSVYSTGIVPTGIVPADAATLASSPTHPVIAPAIPAAVRAGTVDQDVRSGRITVDQLADAAEVNSGSAASLPAAALPAEHARLVTEIRAQVAQIRLERPDAEPATIELGADAAGRLTMAAGGHGTAILDPAHPGSAPAANPLVTSDSWRSFWHAVSHPHIKFHISAIVMKTAVSTIGALTAGSLCAIAGPIGCAFVGGFMTGLVALILGTRCGNDGMWVVFPDTQYDSYCG
ncbi:hypothetical protein [Clavibacter tessellarius]|uniref:hypothetical protein n=1 Tax=Clavibacter tessellarius TaxID=31965 RepID=UPI0039ECEB84